MTYDRGSGVAEGVQDHVSVGVERNVNVDTGCVASDVGIERGCLWFRECTRSSVGVTAWICRGTQVSLFVGYQPVEAPVTVGINTIASQRSWNSGFAPVSVAGAGVFKAIRVGDRDDVPIDGQSDILDGWISRAQKLVNKVG